MQNSQYLVLMRKKFNTLSVLFIFTFFAAVCFPACGSRVNYSDYISENRTDVFVYADDELSFKIHCSERETPYVSDGIKGKTQSVIEVYLKCDDCPSSVKMSAGGYSGEMNYLAVSESFYLSFSGEAFKEEKVEVRLSTDGKERTFFAVSVRHDGLIPPEQALKCVTEYDAKLFESLTEGQHFLGEIYLRLLYDDGCFYYVGVCDRDGEINAYLVNGENGRIIATRKREAKQSA